MAKNMTRGRMISLAELEGHKRGILAIGAILIACRILPEERTQDFRSLTDASIAGGMKVISEPSLDDNTFIYVTNDVAQRAVDIARGDSSKTDT
jgi:hypothetical protein